MTTIHDSKTREELLKHIETMAHEYRGQVEFWSTQLDSERALAQERLLEELENATSVCFHCATLVAPPEADEWGDFKHISEAGETLACDASDIHQRLLELREEQAQPAEQLFYVQDTRTIVGNCAMFECHNRHGYTTDLAKAGMFTRAAAERIVKDGGRRMFPALAVHELKVVHVRHEALDRLAKELG